MNNSKFLRIINVMNSKVRKSNLEFGIREKALKNFLSEALSSEDSQAYFIVIYKSSLGKDLLFHSKLSSL